MLHLSPALKANPHEQDITVGKTVKTLLTAEKVITLLYQERKESFLLAKSRQKVVEMFGEMCKGKAFLIYNLSLLK